MIDDSFHFEGKKTEPGLFKTLEELYFKKDKSRLICCFGYDIYKLYQLMNDSDFTEDIVSVIRNKFKDQPRNNPLKDITDTSDISEIYLFFDYDFQNRNLPLEEINHRLQTMLNFFNNETKNGKLYINYPMIESIRYTGELPDKKFRDYEISRGRSRDFKNIVNQESSYKSYDFIQIPWDKKRKTFRKINATRRDFIKKNWELLRQQHVEKANFICTSNLCVPAKSDKTCISQEKIFNAQLEKYVLPRNSVAILNAFPLFLFEYLK